MDISESLSKLKNLSFGTKAAAKDTDKEEETPDAEKKKDAFHVVISFMNSLHPKSELMENAVDRRKKEVDDAIDSGKNL